MGLCAENEVDRTLWELRDRIKGVPDSNLYKEPDREPSGQGETGKEFESAPI